MEKLFTNTPLDTRDSDFYMEMSDISYGGTTCPNCNKGIDFMYYTGNLHDFNRSKQKTIQYHDREDCVWVRDQAEARAQSIYEKLMFLVMMLNAPYDEDRLPYPEKACNRRKSEKNQAPHIYRYA